MTTPTLSQGLLLDREAIDEHLDRVFQSCGANRVGEVHEAMRYAVMGEGQRLRPILAVRVARLIDSPLESALPAASAVEMLHCASLVVDDLPCMDDEEMRRNRPTLHRAFGESTAILAAFSLVAMAARIVVDRSAPPALLHAQLDFQDRLLGMLDCAALVGGQAMDLGLTRNGGGLSSNAQRTYVNQLKTVPLFKLAVRAGMLPLECSTTRQTLLEFGREVGAAYQAVDDILDGDASGHASLDLYLGNARASLASLSASGERARPQLGTHAQLNTQAQLNTPAQLDTQEPLDTQELEGLLTYIHAKACEEHRSYR